MEERLRDKQILIRVTKEEKDNILKKAKKVGMRLSEYLRHILTR